jgi:hypothetical protein
MDYRYLEKMTDETGILQFSILDDPDPGSGYTVDDNARALLVALNIDDQNQKRIQLANIYIRFLQEAQQSDGRWRNLKTKRGFVPDIDSSDCQGRAFLACSLAASCDLEDVSAPAEEMLKNAFPVVRQIKDARSQAYALLGIVNCLSTWEDKPSCFLDIAHEFCANLIYLYNRSKGTGWYWFEDQITYCNGILPQAVFAYYSLTGDRRAHDTARDTLSFLCDHLFARGYLNVVGNRGWWQKGKQMPLYDQQPVDACSMVLACQEAYLATGAKQYLDLAYLAREWYQGNNINKLSLYNPETGGCYDALEPGGVNRNQGAEALLSWLYSSQILQNQQGH